MVQSILLNTFFASKSNLSAINDLKFIFWNHTFVNE